MGIDRTGLELKGNDILAGSEIGRADEVTELLPVVKSSTAEVASEIGEMPEPEAVVTGTAELDSVPEAKIVY